MGTVLNFSDTYLFGQNHFNLFLLGNSKISSVSVESIGMVSSRFERQAENVYVKLT